MFYYNYNNTYINIYMNEYIYKIEFGFKKKFIPLITK